MIRSTPNGNVPSLVTRRHEADSLAAPWMAGSIILANPKSMKIQKTPAITKSRPANRDTLRMNTA